LNNRRAKWWVPLVRPPLVVLGAIFAPMYDLTFGWLDRRLARKHEDHLTRDIHLALKFLFTDYGARIVPNHGVPFPPSFDYAFVTVEVSDLLMRFSRGRGELGVLVTPASTPNDWRMLTLVLDPLMSEPVHIREGNFRDIWELSRILEKEMKNLTVPKFSQLKQGLGL